MARGEAGAETQECKMEILGLIILVLDVIAIINIVGSPASVLSKVLWSLAILVLPVIGLIAWFFLGPRGRTAIA